MQHAIEVGGEYNVIRAARQRKPQLPMNTLGSGPMVAEMDLDTLKTVNNLHSIWSLKSMVGGDPDKLPAMQA